MLPSLTFSTVGERSDFGGLALFRTHLTLIYAYDRYAAAPLNRKYYTVLKDDSPSSITQYIFERIRLSRETECLRMYIHDGGEIREL